MLIIVKTRTYPETMLLLLTVLYPRPKLFSITRSQAATEGCTQHTAPSAFSFSTCKSLVFLILGTLGILEYALRINSGSPDVDSVASVHSSRRGSAANRRCCFQAASPMTWTDVKPPLSMSSLSERFYYTVLQQA